MQEIFYNGNGGDRVDSWLTSQFSYSRNFFHHIIERGGIQVNNKVVKKSFKLKVGDKIEIDELERYLSPIVLDEAEQIDIPIICEEEDYLVLNKPKGVLSHPNSIWDVKKPSVVGFLYQHYKNLPSYGNFIRAGLVHRLDKDTDGLMIVAKTERGLQHFKSLFQEKSESLSIEERENVPLQKYYRAVCDVTFRGMEFLSEIKKSGLPYYIVEQVIAKVPNFVPKIGITKVLDFDNLGDGLVKMYLQILTGRTHQIRYHLSNHGLLIQGDYLYGKEIEGFLMQLTARKLEYLDLDGSIKVVEI